MIKQKWNISEEERQRILNLHENATKKNYLLREQVEQYTENFGNDFPSGQFVMTPATESSVNEKIKKLVEFAKGKQINNFKVVISSGESQVTNQAGFEQKGSLALARANSLKEYMEKTLPRMLNGYSPKIEISKPIIGTTPYDKTIDNKDDPKYTKEQFVRATIMADTENKPTPKTDPFEAAAKDGESLYLNQRLWGSILYSTRKTNSITDQGAINPNYQDLYVVEFKPDTVPPVIIGKYIVPWDWWNSNVITKQLTPSQVETIKSKFKVS